MSWYSWFLIIFFWSFLGSIIIAIAHDCSEGAIGMAEGLEFVNPIHIYKYNHVNWFGAIIFTLIYNALCPIGSVCYWFYKLCTVGRR